MASSNDNKNPIASRKKSINSHQKITIIQR